jgi:hypothetical protein
MSGSQIVNGNGFALDYRDDQWRPIMNYYTLAWIPEPPPEADKSAVRRVKPGDRKGRPYISMSYEH